VSPQTFCAQIQADPAIALSDESWARGACALCEMYAGVDGQRFEAILDQIVASRSSSVLADGARWVLGRWTATGAQK
jgi:hypothetical protein